MTKNEYKTALKKAGFLFSHQQKGFPGRGEEDVYTHPDFKYKFYVTNVKKGNDPMYGFLTGKINGVQMNAIYPSDTEDTFDKNKDLFIWTDEAFVQLMNRLNH